MIFGQMSLSMTLLLSDWGVMEGLAVELPWGTLDKASMES